MKLFGTFVIGLLLLGACSPDRQEGKDFIEDGIPLLPTEELERMDTQDPNYEEGVRFAIAKAKLMSACSWTALSDVPSTITASYQWDYRAGESYSIPYSSVKELDKFVGSYVSFYTFLSAAHNPRSVLYTEDVSRAPYHGYNCGAYYGTVCSSSVCYALGIVAPYPSRLLCEDSEWFRKVESSSLSELRPADLWAAQGHVILVTDVERDEETGVVKQVEFLDVYSIRNYSREAFEVYCREHQLAWYRYYGLSKNKIEAYDGYSWPELEAMEWNLDLDLSRGDRSTYREGETVRVNLFTEQYGTLRLFRDGVLYEEKSSLTPDMDFEGLPAGRYSLFLTDGEKQSGTVCFEVLETKVQVLENKLHDLKVRFSSGNAEPVAIVIYQEKESTMSKIFVRDLTDEERKEGVLNLTSHLSEGRFFCKVYFKGEYGIVTNDPVAVFN